MADRFSNEPRSDPAVVEVGMDMQLLKLSPPLHSRFEPRPFERRRPQDEADGTATDFRDGEPTAAEMDRIVDEEHRIDPAEVWRILDAERSKSRSGGLSGRHVAFIPPPLFVGMGSSG